METGTIVAVMPPDVPSPVGGLAHAGASLQLGCTQGRTPGAYGIVVSCNLAGYVGPHDVMSSAQLVLTQSGLVGTDPLSSHWSSSLGNGPAQLISDMVRCSRAHVTHMHIHGGKWVCRVVWCGVTNP